MIDKKQYTFITRVSEKKKKKNKEDRQTDGKTKKQIDR